MNDTETATPARSGKRRMKGLAELVLGLYEGGIYLARAAARRTWPVVNLIGRLLAIAALLPLSLLLLLVTWVADLVCLPLIWLARSGRRPAEAARPRPRPRSASIIVVSFNGKHFLEELLPSLRATIEEDGGEHEIIVVDNGSSDGTVAWLAELHPDVRVVALRENLFFVRGNMEGVKVARHDVLVFVNNDMAVSRTFLRCLLDGFTHDDVFATSAQVFFKDSTRRREETGRTRVRWHGGELILAHDVVTDYDTERGYVPVFWAGGGSAAFDRQKFLAIGGFDTLYDPFYMEDTGLSYQAWKRGWRVLFAPAATVLHEHRGTSRKLFGDRYIDGMIRRNQHLFTWRNLTHPRYLGSHFLHLPNLVLKGVRRRDFKFEMSALGRALLRFPLALYLRERDRVHYEFSDRQVFALSCSHVAYDSHYGRSAWTNGRPGQSRLRILFALARLPKRNTDGSWILFNLIKNLGQRHRLTLLSFVDRSDEEPRVAELAPFCEKVDVVLRQQNHACQNLHGLVPRRLALDYTDPQMFRKLDQYLNGGDFDVIQCEYFEMAHMLPDLSHYPSVFTHHEVLSLASGRAMQDAPNLSAWVRPALERMIYLDYERRVCRRFRKVVTLSSVDGDYLKSYDPTLDVVNIPSGVQLGEFAPPAGMRALEKPYVVFVGYYLHPPNLDAAIFLARDIFPLVRKIVPEARCYLVGKEPTAQILELARQDPHVIVTGFVPDLRPLMSQASVVAIPIRQGAGLRGKFLEAWAMGKAVVATSVAAQGFDARDGVHYLQEDRAEGFAERITELLKDPERRQRLGDAGRKLVTERYSDQAMASAYEKIYFDLLEERRR